MDLVVQKIDQTFDVPVVTNFNSRHEQLSEELDNVRNELYDVKNDSEQILKNSFFILVENMTEELRLLMQPKIGTYSQGNERKANKTDSPMKKSKIK